MKDLFSRESTLGSARERNSLSASGVDLDNLSSIPSVNVPGLLFEVVPDAEQSLYSVVAHCIGREANVLLADLLLYFENNFEKFKITLGANESPSKYLRRILSDADYSDPIEMALLIQVLERPILLINSEGKIQNFGEMRNLSGEPIFVANTELGYAALIRQVTYEAIQIVRQLKIQELSQEAVEGELVLHAGPMEVHSSNHLLNKSAFMAAKNNNIHLLSVLTGSRRVNVEPLVKQREKQHQFIEQSNTLFIEMMLQGAAEQFLMSKAESLKAFRILAEVNGKDLDPNFLHKEFLRLLACQTQEFIVCIMNRMLEQKTYKILLGEESFDIRDFEQKQAVHAFLKKKARALLVSCFTLLVDKNGTLLINRDEVDKGLHNLESSFRVDSAVFGAKRATLHEKLGKVCQEIDSIEEYIKIKLQQQIEFLNILREKPEFLKDLPLYYQLDVLDQGQSLLHCQLSADLQDSLNGDSLLMVAVRFASLDCVNFLLSLGANPLLANKNLKTAVSEAIIRGQFDNSGFYLDLLTNQIRGTHLAVPEFSDLKPLYDDLKLAHEHLVNQSERFASRLEWPVFLRRLLGIESNLVNRGEELGSLLGALGRSVAEGNPAHLFHLASRISSPDGHDTGMLSRSSLHDELYQLTNQFNRHNHNPVTGEPLVVAKQSVQDLVNQNRRKDRALIEKDNEIEQKNVALDQKDAALDQAETALAESNAMIAKKDSQISELTRRQTVDGKVVVTQEELDEMQKKFIKELLIEAIKRNIEPSVENLHFVNLAHELFSDGYAPERRAAYAAFASGSVPPENSKNSTEDPVFLAKNRNNVFESDTSRPKSPTQSLQEEVSLGHKNK